MQFETKSGRITVNIPDWTTLSFAILDRWGKGQGWTLATLNLDHLVKLRRDQGFADAYKTQDFVVADGNPVVWLSNVAGRPVTLLPGSDLVAPLCALAVQAKRGVVLVGSTEKSLQKAARRLESLVPGTRVVATLAPPFPFDPSGDDAAKLLEQVAATGAGVCFLALGAPKQEILAARGREIAPGIGFASVGAGLDFLAGTQRRAPGWVRAIKMEWLWRMLSSPFRLTGRYLRCAAILPVLYRDAKRL
ncbi:WecB/TagA/CpsF family glycosyltransferase [Shimia biformata]|uniref:WecB/TagA/CpsF family glycosyltransferase n=1 Tax=Shimia biformata TaxID=1294299 RepID=UPI0030840119